MTVSTHIPSTFKRCLPIALRIIDFLFMLLWPFVVLMLIRLDKLPLMGGVMLGYFGLRSTLLVKIGQPNKPVILLLSLAGALLAAVSMLFNTHHSLMYYPVIVNITLFGLFGYSLYRPPSLIEQLARLHDPNLPVHGQRYTYRVTQIWCGFFSVNGGIAFLTVWWGDPVLWALWNGFISYLLIGMLFIGEWFIRKRVQHADPLHDQPQYKS